MPSYDYQCEDCGHAFAIRASISQYSEGLAARCTECGSSRTERILSSVTVLTASRAGAKPSKSCGCGGSCPPNCSC